MTTAEEHWDGRYAESTRIWSGKPNAALVAELAGLAPGRALDLGSGEGGDAIWLAQQGWQVTAVDVSPIALGRAAEHAREAGIADRIDWQHHELGKTFPAGTFDLVSAQFLHSDDRPAPGGDPPRGRRRGGRRRDPAGRGAPGVPRQVPAPGACRRALPDAGRGRRGRRPRRRPLGDPDPGRA
nr:class I SAM-dependent methyltransferase [Kribbella sandramycini]